jgi:hypothetical protein
MSWSRDGSARPTDAFNKGDVPHSKDNIPSRKLESHRVFQGYVEHDMPIFQMIIRPSLEEPHETLQFIAANLRGALSFANQYRSPAPAQLWQDGICLCDLVYSENDGAWKVTHKAPEAKAS